MELNADFSQPVAVHAARLPWVASPIAGVDRRMLDRIGDELARAVWHVQSRADLAEKARRIQALSYATLTFPDFHKIAQ